MSSGGRLAAAALLLLFPTFARAQPAPDGLAGRWTGVIDGPVPPIVLAVSLAETAGGWTAAVDLPSAGVLGLPLRDVRIDGGRIGFQVPTARGPIVFEGALDGGRIRGVVRLGGRENRFALRPASPDPPPYHARSIRFENGEVTLSGTLFLPRSAGPHPAVVFLHGSGAERRDTARHLADRLARCETAALIWDKRGTGESTGGWVRASFSDLAGDGAAAVRRLREMREIDGDRIGLVGASQGAWLAPLVAARDARIAFLALLSGGAVTPARHALHDDAVRLAGAGYPDSIIARAAELQARLDAYLRTGAGKFGLARDLALAREESWFDLTGLPAEPPPRAAIDPSWWRRHMDYDPVPLLIDLELPLLAVFGGRDGVAPVEENVRRLQEVRNELERAGIRGSLVRVFPDADHTLHEWIDSDGRGHWPRLAAGFPELLEDWIRARVGRDQHGSCGVAD